MSVLHFDSELHQYTIDGVVLPSVTGVLSDVGVIDYSYLPLSVREMALKRGQAVHLATQYADQNELGRVPEWLTGYVDAWQRFRENTGFLPELIEHRSYHTLYRYAGTLDRTGSIGGSVVILDLKTNDAPWWVRIQLAAYAAFFESPRKYRRIAVELHEDGTYRMEEFASREWQRDFDDFLACLTVYQIKRRCMAERKVAA